MYIHIHIGALVSFLQKVALHKQIGTVVSHPKVSAGYRKCALLDRWHMQYVILQKKEMVYRKEKHENYIEG